MAKHRKNSPSLDLTYVFFVKDPVGKQTLQNIRDRQIQITSKIYAPEIVQIGFPKPDQFNWTTEGAGGKNRKKRTLQASK